MKTLIPYLVFPGTCKDAMEFYAQALNGKVTSLTSFGDSPIDVPQEFGARIFDSELVADNVRFKASDDLPNFPVNSGNNFSLFVAFSDNAERKNAFNALSEGGNVQFPLDDNFGMLSDKFGIQWMFVMNQPNN